MSVILISGANSGIGRLTAMTFARHGHQVMAGSRSLERADELVQEARAEALAVTAVQLDVTDEASVNAAVSTTEQSYGPVNVLVNNAGIIAPGPVELISDAAVRTAFEVNFFGPLRLIRRVLPGMRGRRHGSIVLVGSLQGGVPAPSAGAYAASKQAAQAANDALALEVEQFGIRVACVEVGPYRTGIVDKQAVAAPPAGEYTSLVTALGIRGKQRLEESDDPREVAEAILDIAFHDAPPLRFPVGKHSQKYLGGQRVGERFRADLRRELPDLTPFIEYRRI